MSKRNYPKRWLRKLKYDTLKKLEKESRAKEIEIPGSSANIAKPCNSNRCMTCQDIPICHNFESTITGLNYSINSKLDCTSTHLIYMYTCKLCGLQYVGEIGKMLRERNNGHRSATNLEYDSEALYKHLDQKHKHIIDKPSIDQFVLTPIEKLEDLGSKTLNKFLRLQREQFWIDTLITYEPYGLNSKVTDKTANNSPLNIPFIVPFSKMGNASARIIKKHLTKLKDNYPSDHRFDIITAYSGHKNLSDFLATSKLKS